MRTGKGKEAKLVFMGHALMKNGNGQPLDDAQRRGFCPRTLGGDRGYDTRQCVKNMRDQRLTPRVAQRRHSAIYGRMTQHLGYGVSQKIRKQFE